MEFITSRKFEMPSAESDMSNLLWFNMWEYKLFPYEELKVGDVLYWYESKRKSVVWKTSVVNIDRFSYDNKDAAKRRLKKRFGEFDDEQSYYVDAPSQGFCLAFKVKPLQRLNLLKPEGIKKFPQQGWLRVDDEITQKWLKTEIEDDSILDMIIPKGTPIERLRQLT